MCVVGCVLFVLFGLLLLDLFCLCVLVCFVGLFVVECVKVCVCCVSGFLFSCVCCCVAVAVVVFVVAVMLDWFVYFRGSLFLFECLSGCCCRD